jgi:diguanylate cyclase (GGDEF)-like protein
LSREPRAQPAGGASRFEPELEASFRAARSADLIAGNIDTFWSIAIIVLAFGVWDRFVDQAHWADALRVRAVGAGVVVATGLFQKLPGKAHWMPFMAKVRLVAAIVASIIAAATLDRGYGFGVAGIVAIILTGPYISVDTRDLLVTNAAVLAAVGIVMVWAPLDTFDVIGTIVFVLLAALVSTLLGRVLEASYRRAFILELESHRDARTDALTGLDNRRAIQEKGLLELKRAQRIDAPVAVILCDVDHFKRINDRLGHEAGDAVLRRVADVLRSGLRETDLIGRWGGEEFIAVMLDADAAAARDVAERMRKAVAAMPFEGLRDGATISFGVSSLRDFHSIPEDWEALLKKADEHLYRAKSEGRNRVVA